MQSRPDQIIALSIDYDGCGQDLFRRNSDDMSVIKTMNEISTSFLNGLHQLIASASKYSNVEVHVYVGSARQDIATDKKTNERNQNGSCFENYSKLCAEQGWIFEPLLLADKHNNQPSGTAIKNENLCARSFDANKIEILQSQLDDITSKFPSTPIEFTFINDANHGHQILDTNSQHFQFILPQNVSLNLVQYQLHREIEPKTLKISTNTSFLKKYRIKSELTLDPIHASLKESIILNQLLVSCVRKDHEIFYPSATYVGELNIGANPPLRKTFKLTSNFGALYFRPCATTSYGYRFEIVSSQQLGSGGYGAIFNGITTLIPQQDGSLACKTDTHPQHPPRAHKFCTGKYPIDAERMQNRNNNNKLARHLRVKQLAMNGSTSPQPRSFTAMKKMPGRDLLKVLSESMLNTQQSLSIALSILYAYRDQLHAYQLVHGDIKPENLLIAYTKPTTTHFVDFDFCKLTSSSNRNITGTLGYYPPEFREKNHRDYRAGSTPASDKYALGLTIGQIFFKMLDDLVRYAYYLDFSTCKPSDISADEKYRIKQCIMLLTDADPAKRCSIDTAIEIFERLELMRLPESADIQCHYEQAAAFSKSMREAFAGKPASSENIIAFLQQFIQEMEQQTHNELSRTLSVESKQFIATVAGIPTFQNHTKIELLQLASSLLVKYQNQASEIKSYLNHLALIAQSTQGFNNELINIGLQINQFIEHVTLKLDARSNKYPLTLENIQTIYNKSEKEKNQLIDYCNTFKNGLNRNSSHHLFKPVKIERQRAIAHTPNASAAAAAHVHDKASKTSINFTPAPKQAGTANMNDALNNGLSAFTYDEKPRSPSKMKIDEVDCYSINQKIDEVDCYSIKRP